MSQHHTSNWIRSDKRLAIYLRDGFCCAYCGADLSEADPFNVTLDHIKPASKGGTNGADNLVTACRSCNSRRQDKPVAAFARSEGLDLDTLRNRLRRQRARKLAPYRIQAKAIIAIKEAA